MVFIINCRHPESDSKWTEGPFPTREKAEDHLQKMYDIGDGLSDYEIQEIKGGAMNLYNKHRPRTFEDLIGNESEIEALKSKLAKPERPHVYLLTGPSGCGKTTLARIAANQLGADEMSITEINSANNRGIDTAREIIQQLTYVPTSSGVRIFIIDELHQTSKDWQDAMLKPLEDTPPHVYFFLCTTDPGKLKAALVNRCTQFKVAAQDSEVLYRYLRKIALAETLTTPKDVIREIAENCNGSPRLALVLLEKVADMTNEKDMKAVISMGEDDQKEVIELCRALLNGNWKTVAPVIKVLKDVDPEKARLAVLGYMKAVLLNSGQRKAAVIMECFSEPFYNTGLSGLTLASFQAVSSE